MSIEMNMKKSWMYSFCFVAAFAAMFMPEFAIAGDGGDAIAEVLCTVVEWFTGPLGKGLATLAVIVIGIGALMGKVSWGMALIVGTGIAIVFGAVEIVDAIGVETADGCVTDGVFTPTPKWLSYISS